jgi:hypothetical protein
VNLREHLLIFHIVHVNSIYVSLVLLDGTKKQHRHYTVLSAGRSMVESYPMFSIISQKHGILLYYIEIPSTSQNI